MTAWLDGGTMLHDVLGRLIDMEVLINHLNEVSRVLLVFSSSDSSDATIMRSFQVLIYDNVLILQTILI